MGLLDIFKKKPAEAEKKPAYTMTGGYPVFSDFGDDIYASDIIIQSIRCKANEFKKLQPRHIRTASDGTQSVIHDSSVAKILRQPNAWMTQCDFLEKVAVMLELNKNVFIYPEWYKTKGGEKYYTALYPLKPSVVEYLMDASGKLFIKMEFASGYKVTLPASDVIHWRKDFGFDEYFGGNIAGGNDNAGVLKLLKQYDKVLQSIAKGLELSCQVKGILKINTYLADEKQQAEADNFVKKLEDSSTGIVVSDLKTEWQGLQGNQPQIVDANLIKFLHESILRHNGTSLAVFSGDYTKAQKEAYYEHSLEADIKSLGQAMSKVLFTGREESFGNAVVLYPNSIEFMSMQDKLEAMKSGLPAGIFTKNEARALLGYPPIEGGDVMPRGYNSVDPVAGSDQDEGGSEE